jgi:hypothetical protein
LLIKSKALYDRVARWYIFKPKIPIWVNFGCIAMEDVGKLDVHLVILRGIFYGYLVILRAFGIFYGHLVYFPPFWYILPTFFLVSPEAR